MVGLPLFASVLLLFATFNQKLYVDELICSSETKGRRPKPTPQLRLRYRRRLPRPLETHE